MSKVNLFFSTAPSVQTITPKGKTIIFVAGRYATANAEEIEFLQGMVEHTQGAIYVDPDKVQVDSSELDPMTALRNKIIADYEQEKLAHINPENDMGESVQGKLNAASTTSIAPVAAGGNATALHTQVAKMIKAGA